MTANVVKLKVVKESKYDFLVKQGRALEKEHTNINWKFGELASRVTKSYGGDKLGQFAEDILVNKQHLEFCRSTCQKWPQKSGRPDFWTAYALNAHPNRFKIVAKNPNITQREARVLMQEYNAKQLDRQQLKEDIELIESGKAEMTNFQNPPKELEDKADCKSVLEIPMEGRVDNATEAYTRSVYSCACSAYSNAQQAKKIIDKANLKDKAVIDAIHDALKAWRELFDLVS